MDFCHSSHEFMLVNYGVDGPPSGGRSISSESTDDRGSAIQSNLHPYHPGTAQLCGPPYATIGPTPDTLQRREQCGHPLGEHPTSYQHYTNLPNGEGFFDASRGNAGAHYLAGSEGYKGFSNAQQGDHFRAHDQSGASLQRRIPSPSLLPQRDLVAGNSTCSDDGARTACNKRHFNFPCPVATCAKGYKNESCLKRHMDPHHRGIFYHCDIQGCTRWYGRKDKLTEHKKDFHSLEVPRKTRSKSARAQRQRAPYPLAM